LIWNYPRGKIFLGDGGAYLLGFWLAELSVLLVVRHPEVSPWFPMLLLVYPIFETLFSMYRSKVLQ
jgi:UDP-N-acetylmuramyl pentapeptide phosphotransferase/UDP-N-acetylglucosamine-1-phosphate transferase